MDTRLINPEFVASYPKWTNKLVAGLPQICFAGRSNVGKSSLINALAGMKGLAKASSTPGRTQALVVFRAALRQEQRTVPFALVDLPGYGYAEVPLSVKRAWRPMMMSYFRRNDALKTCVFLMDCRREPRDEDIELLEMMEEEQVPVLPVVTKVDKVAKPERPRALRRIAEGLGLESAEDLRVASAQTREGIQELLDDLFEVLTLGPRLEDPLPPMP